MSIQNHALDSDTVQKYINVTKVEDCASQEVSPYMRRISTGSGSVNPCDGGEEICTDNHRQDSWGSAGSVPPSDLVTCAKTPIDPFNCVEAVTDETVSLGPCVKRGWKGVQAQKTWHGRHGFITSPSQTKYLVFKLESETSREWPEDAYNEHYYWHNTLPTSGYAMLQNSVGRYTGIRVVDSCISSDEENEEVSICWNRMQDYFALQFSWSEDRYEYWLNALGASESVVGSVRSFTVTDSVECNGETETRTVYEASVNTATGEYLFKQYDCVCTDPGADPSVYSWQQIKQEEAAWTETTFVITFTTHIRQPEWGHYIEVNTLSGTLSTAYTSTNVWTDITQLLDQWDLTDDAVYPFRLDSNVSVCPLLHYNEVETGAVSPDTTAECDADPSADEDVYDGEIAGAPAKISGTAVAGIDYVFSWGHRTWRFCYTETGGSFNIYGYGARTKSESATGDATDLVVPAAATNWRENYNEGAYNAGSLPGGAWSIFDGETLHVQKWCETTNHRPSINFARPCGQDRYAFAVYPTKVDDVYVEKIGCATAGDGYIETDIDLGITDGTLCRVIKIDGYEDGLYTAVNSGTKKYTLTFVEAPIGMPDRSELTSVIGALRWPTARGIGGRVGVVTAAQEDTLVRVVVNEGIYLRVGDLLDFQSVGSLGTSVAVVEVVSATQFTVTGTVGSYTIGGYVISHGAPAYQHDYEGSCGDFLMIAWGFNTSLECNSITVYECCLPFSPCAPRVVCWSPCSCDATGEFPNGYTKSFGGTDLDTVNGNRWQGAAISEMVDPFYARPAAPCGAGTWREDTECDCSKEYPHRRMVEARDSFPDGSPEPAEVVFGLTIANCPPPEGHGYGLTSADGTAQPIESLTIWDPYENQLASAMDENCAFAEYYRTFI